MKKVVEHFQSNWSAGWSAGRTLPLMEVVPPPKKCVELGFLPRFRKISSDSLQSTIIIRFGNSLLKGEMPGT
jgi:hypothetical protein